MNSANSKLYVVPEFDAVFSVEWILYIPQLWGAEVACQILRLQPQIGRIHQAQNTMTTFLCWSHNISSLALSQRHLLYSFFGWIIIVLVYMCVFCAIYWIYVQEEGSSRKELINVAVAVAQVLCVLQQTLPPRNSWNYTTTAHQNILQR